MYGERRAASDGDVAGWLERVSARLRELEAENAQLKQQLADLRHGLGIAVVIDGKLVPLAPQPASAPPQPSAPRQQPQQPQQQPRPPRQTGEQLPHLTGYPAGQMGSDVSRHTGSVPVPMPVPPAQPAPAISHRAYPPLAATPEQLPAIRGLLPAPEQPTREWLGAGDAWPDATPANPAAPAARPARPGRTLRHATGGPPPLRDSYPPARHQPSSDPIWRDLDRERTSEAEREQRNPYADSFML